MSDRLPSGWVQTTITEISDDISYGFTAKSETLPVGPRLLRITDIQHGTVNWESVPYCKISENKVDNYALQPGDIVFARTGATTGKSFLIGTCPHAVFASYLIRVRPKSSTLPEFIAYFFQSARYWDQISENLSGSAQPNCNASKLATVSLPLAPLPEQRRIVAKLEALLGKVDACQQRLEKIPVLLKRFRQSVLAAACSGRLTADWREKNRIKCERDAHTELPDGFPLLPNTWRWQSLESVCEKIVDCPHSTPKWTENGRICVRTTNFKPGYLDLSEVRYVSNETFKERIERLRPKGGDILYSREGGILGIACKVPLNTELCLGQRMMLFRVRLDFVANLLMYWLNSPVIVNRVQELTGGSASPHLNVRDIKAFPTPAPPFPEQQEIVLRIERLFALSDQLEARLSKARQQVYQLTPSLLARAFAGKLVPQDPNDEPAEKLLERIGKQQKIH